MDLNLNSNGRDESAVNIYENIDEATDLPLILRQQNEKIEKLESELKEIRALLIPNEVKLCDEHGMDSDDQMQIDTSIKDADCNDHQPSKKSKGENEENNVQSELQFLESPAMSKALGIPLILMKILEKMSPRNLLQNCRLVNREWNELSTNILLKRKDVQVCLKHEKKLSKFVLVKNKEFELTELTSVLIASKGMGFRFPCVSFNFKGDLSCEDAQEFLDYHGTKIQEVKLEGEINKKDVRKLLLDQVPSLSCLKIDALKPSNAQEKLFPQSEAENDSEDGENVSEVAPKLSSLTSLELENSSYSEEVIKEIVRAAPNLKVCGGRWWDDEAESLISRIHLLKKLVLFPTEDSIPSIENLSKQNLRLDFLGILPACLKSYEFDDNYNEISSRFEASLRRILSSTQTTLKELDFALCDDLRLEILWPELKNVDKLRVTVNFDDLAGAFFPLSDFNFPNLHTVVLDEDKENIERHEDAENAHLMWRNAEKSFGFPFPFTGVASSVKSLHICGRFSRIEKLPDIFPNLEHLRLTKITDFPEVGKTLWKMTGLKSLDLDFEPSKFNTLCKVDATFTGFEKLTCKFLLTCGNGLKLRTSQIEKLRVNPSILDLTNLRELQLRDRFRMPKSKENLDPNDSVEDGISFLSKTFAIDMLPDLRPIQ